MLEGSVADISFLASFAPSGGCEEGRRSSFPITGGDSGSPQAALTVIPAFCPFLTAVGGMNRSHIRAKGNLEFYVLGS